MQEAFPGAYAETRCWLQQQMGLSEGSLEACKRDLNEALQEDELLRNLISDFRVRVFCFVLRAATMTVSSLSGNHQNKCIGVILLRKCICWLVAPRALRCVQSPMQIEARHKSLFSVMKKLLRLEDLSKGGCVPRVLFDLLGMRIIVEPRDDLPLAVAEQRAIEVSLSLRSAAKRTQCRSGLAIPAVQEP